jgi:hypothetical protein
VYPPKTPSASFAPGSLDGCWPKPLTGEQLAPSRHRVRPETLVITLFNEPKRTLPRFVFNNRILERTLRLLVFRGNASSSVIITTQASVWSWSPRQSVRKCPLIVRRRRTLLPQSEERSSRSRRSSHGVVRERAVYLKVHRHSTIC